MGACGHDFCELCYQQWTVDQRKTTCPACRQALAADLPGACLRLQRTLEALFPEVGADDSLLVGLSGVRGLPALLSPCWGAQLTQSASKPPLCAAGPSPP